MALSSSSDNQQLLHLVAVPVPAQGHLNPLMRLCKLLASQPGCGVRVTFVNIAPVHHRLTQLHRSSANQPDSPLREAHAHLQEEGSTPELAADATPTLLPPWQDRIAMAHVPVRGMDLATGFQFSFESMTEELSTIAAPLEALILKLNQHGPPVTCILSDFFLIFPTKKVADKLKIPIVAFYPNSASVLLLSDHVTKASRIPLSKVLDASTRRDGDDGKEVFCEGLSGLPTIYNCDLLYFKHVVDESRYAWEFTTQAMRACSDSARAMVVNSFKELEAPALAALSEQSNLSIYGVGPLLDRVVLAGGTETSTSLWKEDEACMSWLAQQPTLSVLYISFGSIVRLSQPQVEEIVAGLLTSRQRFLWVYRPDLVENKAYCLSDVRARFNEDQGYFVDWAPQVRVLSHPSVGGFLTHCGWNSTIEAITHRVPMLCFPYGGDQFLNAKYTVEEWKVGLRFQETTANYGSDSSDKQAEKVDPAGPGGGATVERLINRDEVERVIKSLMEGEEGRAVRKNVELLGEAGFRSLLPGGASHTNVHALFKSLHELIIPLVMMK